MATATSDKLLNGNGLSTLWSRIKSIFQTKITGAASSVTDTNLTANRVVTTTSGGKLQAATINTTKLGYLSGVSSDIQTQLDGKQPTLTAGGGIEISTGVISAKVDGSTINVVNGELAVDTTTFGTQMAAQNGGLSANPANGQLSIVTPEAPLELSAADGGQLQLNHGAGLEVRNNTLRVKVASTTDLGGIALSQGELNPNTTPTCDRFGQQEEHLAMLYADTTNGGAMSAADKTKLNGIATGATQGVQINQGGNGIQLTDRGNVTPTLDSGTGEFYLNYTLPTASTTTLGGVKVGANLDVTNAGVLSVPAAGDDAMGVVALHGVSGDAEATNWTSRGQHKGFGLNGDDLSMAIGNGLKSDSDVLTLDTGGGVTFNASGKLIANVDGTSAKINASGRIYVPEADSQTSGIVSKASTLQELDATLGFDDATRAITSSLAKELVTSVTGISTDQSGGMYVNLAGYVTYADFPIASSNNPGGIVVYRGSISDWDTTTGKFTTFGVGSHDELNMAIGDGLTIGTANEDYALKVAYDGTTIRLNNSDQLYVPDASSTVKGVCKVAASLSDITSSADATTVAMSNAAVGAQINQAIAGLTGVQFHKYNSYSDLPTAGSAYTSYIALVPISGASSPDAYEEYICVNAGTTASPTYVWEKIGDTNIDLSNYVTFNDYLTESEIDTIIANAS